jgi:hypothetical protein
MKSGNLQEEFAPCASLRGRFAAGVVATEGDCKEVELLPLAHLHCTNRTSSRCSFGSAVQVSLGDFVRRRISALEPRSPRGGWRGCPLKVTAAA